jgi:hypothetical protein
MSHLPVEILDLIIRDLRPHHGQKLAPLATINRHWQSAVEAILWGHIEVMTADIDLFKIFCQTRTRKQAVKHIIFNAEYFKQLVEQGSMSDDEDVAGYGKYGQDKIPGSYMVQEEDKLVDTEPRCDRNNGSCQGARHSLSAIQAEKFRFFYDTRKIWVTLARTEVQSIQIIVDGCSFYEHLGLKFWSHDGFQTFLCAKDWLGQCPTLPVLLSVEVFIKEPKFNTDVDLWTAIAGCAIARTLPALKELKVMGDDRDRRWVGVKRECREGTEKC